MLRRLLQRLQLLQRAPLRRRPTPRLRLESSILYHRLSCACSSLQRTNTCPAFARNWLIAAGGRGEVRRLGGGGTRM
jgi:hypothetical protein